MALLPFDDTAVFVQVAESGSFSAASKALGLPKSTISRTIARLEDKLGLKLIQRSTRSMHLTGEGEVYYAQCAAAVSALVDAAEMATQSQSRPKGLVRLNAPPDIGSEVLPQVIAEFCAEYPEIVVDTHMTPEPPSLSSGTFDIALYGGTLPDSNLVMRKLQDTRFDLYASPDYLKQHGTPTELTQLADHRCVLFRPKRGRADWVLTANGQTYTQRVTGPEGANDLSFVRRATLAGAGIALLPTVMAAPYRENGTLVQVLPEFSAKGTPLFIILPSRSFVPSAVAALQDAILKWFQAAER